MSAPQSLRNWGVENWNDFNIYETGFLEEFKKAQSNLRATVADGLCATLGDVHVRLPRAQTRAPSRCRSTSDT